MLAGLGLCSIEKKSRSYDHEVKGLSVVKPFIGVHNDVPSDASVMLIDYESTEGVLFTEGINPHLSDLDTYHMATSIVDLAVRRAVGAGARLDHMAGLDNFCWPDPVQSEKTPDGRYKLAQLVRANQALYDITTAYGVPLISGKDSMKNDSTRGGVKISIPPTILFSLIGKIDDVRRAVTMDAKCPGDLVYVVGLTADEMGASEYYRYLGDHSGNKAAIGSRVPTVDIERALGVLEATSRAVGNGLLRSAHALGKGGLGVGLAKVAFASELGLDVDLGAVPATNVCCLDGECEDVPHAPVIRDDALLFSESNSRYVVTIAPEDKAAFEGAMADVPCACVGEVVAEPRMHIIGQDGSDLIDADVLELKSQWKATLDAI
jgi:phosphoribosylformylglycinamidine synthase